MRKYLALTLVLAMAVMVGSFADASGAADIDPADATTSGVKYDWYGSQGDLSIVGTPGTKYAVFDSNGAEVGGGALAESEVTFVVGNSGYGPGGVVLWVLIGDEVFASTDPDWSW